MRDTERRRAAAYWYAAGWSDATKDVDLSHEFGTFAAGQAEDYYAERRTFLPSVPDQWSEFVAQRLSTQVREAVTSEAVAFFHEHAGWGYDPATETPEEGRQRSAERMAEAEAWAKAAGVSFRWSDDWGVGSHVDEYDSHGEEPETCEVCVAYLGGEVVAALGCVDDATDEYRRVIEAELAYEAMPDLAEVAR